MMGLSETLKILGFDIIMFCIYKHQWPSLVRAIVGRGPPITQKNPSSKSQFDHFLSGGETLICPLSLHFISYWPLLFSWQSSVTAKYQTILIKNKVSHKTMVFLWHFTKGFLSKQRVRACLSFTINFMSYLKLFIAKQVICKQLNQ